MSRDQAPATGVLAEPADPVTGLSDAAPPADGDTSSGRSLGHLFAFKRVSGLYIWLLVILVFSLWIPDLFLTEVTWTTLAAEQAVTTIVAVGLVVALAAGVFDLSVGATLGMAAAITAHLITREGWPAWAAVVVALGFGALVGLVNGLVVVRFKVDSFIATLGMSSVLFALLQWITENQQIVGLPSSYLDLASTKILGIPLPFYIMLVLALVLWYVMEWTPLGRYIEATGGNREAARLAGVPAQRLIVLSFVVSGTVAALGGVVVLARISGASPTLGNEYVLPVFAAAFVGATQFRPGRFNIAGTVVAVYLLATGTKGLQLAGAEPWITQLFYGIALILAVGLASLERRERTKRRFRARRGPTKPAEAEPAQA